MSDSGVTFHTAGAAHEMFYNELVEIALRHKLRDEELAAIVGRLMGYQVALAPTASTIEHLVTVFRINARRGFEDMKAGRAPVQERN